MTEDIIDFTQDIPLENSNTHDTHDTYDTHNTHNTSDVAVLSVLLPSEQYPEKVLLEMKVFEDNIKDKILETFAIEGLSKPQTYDFLALKLQKNIANIRQAINRNKEMFDFSKPDGRKNFVSLKKDMIHIIHLKIQRKSEEIIEKRDSLLENREKSECFNLERETLIKEAKKFIELNKSKLFELVYENIIYLDFEDLCIYSHELSESLISKPEETLQLIELSIEELGFYEKCRVRVKNLPEIYERKIEHVRSEDLNSLIKIHGRVMQLSDIRPQVVNAKFECPSCGTIISVLQVEKKFREPSRCSCGRRGAFGVLSKEMVDTARLILEDLHEKSDNPLSKRINCFIKEDLTNKENIKKVFPGNEVIIHGVLKEVPVSLPTGGLGTRFELAVEVNNVELSDDEITMDNFSEEEIKEFKELAAKIDVEGMEEINKSFSPDVYGNTEIKNALLFFLANRRNDKKKSKVRNKSNILLIGDPGTAKSVTCNEAVSITPGAKKQTGGSASAVGLTASVIRDDYSGGWALQPGALVLAKEFTFLDELNNLGDDEKPKLQEAMSEQEINIAKASIQAKLPITGGIIACANPRNGIFDPQVVISKQFNIPPAILNRFDLVFVLRDEVNKENDRNISRLMIRRHREMNKQKYDNYFLKKFMFYIRNSEEPVITDSIEDKMVDIYENVRKFKTKDKYINARLQESLIRMCIASAKLRLSNEIEEKDIERAISVLSKSYYMLPEYAKIKDNPLRGRIIEKLKKAEDELFKPETPEEVKIYSDLLSEGVIFEPREGKGYRWLG